MKLSDLKITEEEKKKRKKDMEATCCGPVGGDDYPWGTQVEFGKEAIEKMGVSLSDFGVGDEIRLAAVCKVVAVSERDKGRGRIELQIMKCGLAPDDNVDKAFEQVTKDKAPK